MILFIFAVFTTFSNFEGLRFWSKGSPMIGIFASVVYSLYAFPITAGEPVPKLWEELLASKFLLFCTLIMMNVMKVVVAKNSKVNSWFIHMLSYLLSFFLGAIYFNFGANFVGETGFFWTHFVNFKGLFNL